MLGGIFKAGAGASENVSRLLQHLTRRQTPTTSARVKMPLRPQLSLPSSSQSVRTPATQLPEPTTRWWENSEKLLQVRRAAQVYHRRHERRSAALKKALFRLQRRLELVAAQRRDLRSLVRRVRRWSSDAQREPAHISELRDRCAAVRRACRLASRRCVLGKFRGRPRVRLRSALERAFFC